MIFVNFKTYKEGTGEEAVKLAKICEEVAKKSGVEIILVAQVVDLYRLCQEVKIPVWVQHLDWHPQGQFTGFINLEAVVESGASGTILNHAEHRIPPGTIKQVIKRRNQLLSNQVTKKFMIMVCCRTLGQAERLVKLKPDFLAYEPPELIGGDLSVSEAKPEVIKRIIKKIPQIPIIVGAGIKGRKDVQKSLRFGAKGILVSSGVVLARDPKEVLLDLASAFKISFG